MWPVNVEAHRWRRGTLAFEKNFEFEPNDIWSELQVSVCDDKSEPTLGYAEPREGNKCTHHIGQTLTIPPESIETSRWYLICYTKSSGCSQCHLEALCDNEFTSECADIWMLNSISVIRNDSMTMWMKIGKRYPFIKWTSVQITVKDQARDKRLAKYEQIPQLDKQLEIELTDLHPSGWYLVETCLHIEPPKSFVEEYNVELNEYSRDMCKTGSYRTKASSATNLFVLLSPFRVIFCFVNVVFILRLLLLHPL
ncbi:unnamed protein product [Anisakis simplex]|uniref:Uncharacterized protein n=1 Tax=Anisakis simplex TaxID=6269 RepID=A0A3P6MZA9_ANISI|nr:unnamed protein product [Anisakis simplex]